MISTPRSRWGVFRLADELKKLISRVMTHNSDVTGKSGVDCNYGAGQRASREIPNTTDRQLLLLTL